MTHAEAIKVEIPIDPDELKKKVQLGRVCLGVLTHTGTFPDTMIDSSHAVVPRSIDLYRCPRCRSVLSIERPSGRVLNCYPCPDDLVRELAHAFDAGKHLPTEREEL